MGSEITADSFGLKPNVEDVNVIINKILEL